MGVAEYAILYQYLIPAFAGDEGEVSKAHADSAGTIVDLETVVVPLLSLHNFMKVSIVMP